MYCVVESPKVLSVPILEPSHIRHIKANKDSMFICAITSTDIMIWFTPSSMMIAFHQRADNSVSIHGENCLVDWKNDTSKIVVMTTKGYLIYYKIAFENEFVITDLSYAQTAWDDSIFSSKTQYQNPLLSCKISHEFSIHVQNAHKTFCCFNDEIYVPLYNGKIIKVPWTDRTKGDHFFLLLQRIYFQYEPEDDLFKIKENIYVTEFELMNADDGTISMAAVLSDGSAIYLATDHTNTFRGLIARTHTQEKVVYHRCVAMNPLFKMLAFGCKNGTAIAYNQPDDYTCLHFSHKYAAPSNKDRDSSSVASLRWSPDYRMLCVVYENGTFCMFSVFGSLLYDSKDSLEIQISSVTVNCVKTLDFGIEGYSIWSYVQAVDPNVPGQLVKLKVLKSSIINNSSMGSIEHVSLNGEREIYICLNLTRISNPQQTATEASEPNAKKKITAKYQYPAYKLGGNSIWQILNVPLTYLSTNFPIRLSAIDPDGRYLAVAGTHGFTHFSFVTRKWKIFGNADQEKDIRVTGGLIWWREFICMSCYNSVDQRDEIRFYSRNSNLDNNYSKISKTSAPILQMNIFKNLLIIFGMDCRVQVFGLEGGKDSTTKIILNKLIEIPIENYILNNPYLVISVGLCPLYIGHFDSILKKNIESFSTPIKSILVNVSGNLLMFQPDIESLVSIPEDLKKTKPFSSLPPIIISTNVENYWVVPSNHFQKLYNYLMNLSLWLNCGCHGVKVWLAMTNEEGELEQSNRVILNVPVKFYPLGLLINESLLVGVDTELIGVNQSCTYSQIQKTTQLFMPSLIEGMIKKRFSDDAKRLVLGYSYLPYFLHILELLVHKTLEEEAPLSPTDTSNRLLDSVIKFISQFPEYLRIISHCTRKSEIAFWPYLFSIVGDSKNLFEECLKRNDLETAASYLVVLQNIEHIKLCEKFANTLLSTALKNCEWDLVKEIIRFLGAIDPADLEENDVFIMSAGNGNNNPATPKTPAENPGRLTQSAGAPNGRKASISVRKTPLAEGLEKTSSVSLSANTSVAADEACSPKQLGSAKSVSNSNSKLSKMRSFASYEQETNKKSIEESIYEHAYGLLKSCSIKQLFEMFANLPAMNILKWLGQYNSMPLVDSFVQALQSIHFEFNWPYPIYIQNKKTSSFMVNAEFYDPDQSQNPSSLIGIKKDGSSNDVLTTTTTYTTSELDSERFSCKISINESEIESLNNADDIFDFDLIAQELANTGSSLAERQLTHALDVFFSARCYEWVFLLALVLKKFTIANEIVRLIKSPELGASLRTSLKKGLDELEEWSHNECCGYRSVMQNIHH